MQNHQLKGIISIYLCIAFIATSFAQEQTIPQLKSQLNLHSNDTLGVEIFRQLSLQIQSTRPDSALMFAQHGLDLARKLQFKKGEADCMNRLGVVLWKNGKYDRALSVLLGSLKIREEIKDRLGILKSNSDIGIIYSDQKDNEKVLSYHFKAKAVAEELKEKRRLGIILSNIGNCYIKLDKVDSALNYEMQAYAIQQSMKDMSTLPNTLSILGDIHYKMGHDALALDYYKVSVNLAAKNNDHSGLSDTYNSIAKLYKQKQVIDSSIYYAVKALNSANSAMYPEGIYSASNLLTEIYQGKNDRLELRYLKKATAAKDSMFNAEKVKQIQTLSFNEAIRQEEIAAEKHREEENRIINLQMISIAIFIPIFFLIVLALNKSRTHRKVIEFMSVLSLLFVFEFIALFIHPFVQRVSNHLPLLELAILVAFASVLVPLHHKMTNWMREKLAHPHSAPVKAKAKISRRTKAIPAKT
ncbi:tetratricopeptide repeat protein [Pedobacter chinensis]|uniref:Tetratricopeptide repeat protein n=1 Tax=Pedobacter chinensis TaxID=2282421 RepID=A0A369PY61_9SPHI|nr:tetratricopeptide repeat protein [Pedobacter chinensis]RDC56155.1 tetratricopeptide repeat protein [Pedobacter chinensis]